MAKRLKWISNTTKPSSGDTRSFIIPLSGNSHQEEYDAWLQWLSDKVIGLPKGTHRYSDRELEDMGMIGVYIWEDYDEEAELMEMLQNIPD